MSASGVLFSDMVPSNTTYAEIVGTISDSGAVTNNSTNWINMLLDCNPVRQNLTIIIIIILFLLTCIIGILGTHFIFRYNICSKQNNPKQNPKLILFCYIFIIITFLYMLSIIVVMVSVCNDNRYFSLLYPFYSFFYIIQAMLIIVIWLYRIHIIFRDTELLISKVIVIIYVIIIIFLLILAIIHGMSYLILYDDPQIWSKYSHLWSYLGCINLLLYISLCLSISMLYIHKLHASFNGNFNTKHLKLAPVIVKTSILNFMTMFVTLLNAICLIFRADSIYMEYLSELFMAIDVFTNFLCVVLSYKHYERFYFLLCGCLDNKCTNFCSRPIDQIHSTSPQI